MSCAKSLFSNIMAEREESPCSSCFKTTKYTCLSCREYFCMVCSVFEEDESAVGWKAGSTLVKANQQSAIQQRALKLQKVKLTRSQFEAEDVTFSCKKCGVFACKAHDFRVLRDTYYVVVTKEIQDKIKVKPHHKPWREKGVEVNEKVHCINCDEDWGVIVTIRGIPLPSFKIKSFLLKMSDGSKKSIKTWSKRPFEVAPAEFEDFLSLC